MKRSLKNHLDRSYQFVVLEDPIPPPNPKDHEAQFFPVSSVEIDYRFEVGVGKDSVSGPVVPVDAVGAIVYEITSVVPTGVGYWCRLLVRSS
jgi:hypothetical protein